MSAYQVVSGGSSWPEHLTFSPAVRSGNLLFISGTTASDDRGEIVGKGDIVAQTRYIYEKFGRRHEWRMAQQGLLLAGALRELPITPHVDVCLGRATPVFWSPNVGAALMGETVLAGSSSGEIVTASELWPTKTVQVKGHPIECAAILKRISDEP